MYLEHSLILATVKKMNCIPATTSIAQGPFTGTNTRIKLSEQSPSFTGEIFYQQLMGTSVCFMNAQRVERDQAVMKSLTLCQPKELLCMLPLSGIFL